MVEVKLQERVSKQGKNEYSTYVVTLPKSIVEALPNLMKNRKFDVVLEKGRIVLVPK